jgi:hypothetical protein
LDRGLAEKEDVSIGPQATDDFGTRRAVNGQALGADGGMEKRAERRSWRQIEPCARERPMADLKKVLANPWSRKKIMKKLHTSRGQETKLEMSDKIAPASPTAGKCQSNWACKTDWQVKPPAGGKAQIHDRRNCVFASTLKF